MAKMAMPRGTGFQPVLGGAEKHRPFCGPSLQSVTIRNSFIFQSVDGFS